MSTLTWPQYLQEHNIPPDPLSRSQWESPLSKTRQRPGLPKTGLQMEHKISDDVKRKLRKATVDRFPKMRWSKQQVEVTVISSLPGGGKTRFLAELLNLLGDSEIRALYYVTFGSSSRLLHNDFDNMDDEEAAQKSIAMRILYEAVQAHSNTDQVSRDFASWISDVRNLGLEDVHNIDRAISLLGGDTQRKCIVAVDEVNKLKEDFTSTGLQSEKALHVAMTNLVSVLGYSMLYTQTFTFMAGTLISDFVRATRTSGIYINIFGLSILSRAQQYAILDAYPGLSGWRRSAKLKKILTSLGGIPRLVEALIEQVEGQLNGTNDFEHISWTTVELFLGYATATYNWRGESVELARSLVDIIMLRESRHPANRISMEDAEGTLEKLQHNSQIVLQQDESGSLYPTMPLLAFRTLVKKAKSGDGDCDRFRKLDSLLDHMDIQYWQEFEVFASKYSNVMNGFFAQLSEAPLSLSRRYAEAHGGLGDLSTTFLKSHPDWRRCLAHFPDTIKITSQDCDGPCSFASGDYYLNAPQANFADGFYVCKITEPEFTTCLSDDVMSDESSDSWEQPEPSFALVTEQMRKWTSRNFRSQNCIDEHKKNMSAFRNIPERARYRLITIIIAACHIPSQEDLSGLEDIVVIDITKFEEFYGILAPLVIQGSGRVDINTVTVKDLEKALGFEDTAEKVVAAKIAAVAAKIVEQRGKGGFKDKEALQERMSDVGVLLEQWVENIDDWDF